MRFNIGPPKTDNIETLPKYQQVIITLETQKEIDQLYAIINFVPIIEAVDLREGDWISLRENLSVTPVYNTWHEKLSEMLRE